MKYSCSHNDITPKKKILILEERGTTKWDFLNHIIKSLKGTYEIKYVKTNMRDHRLKEFISWADIIWLEWGNRLAVHITRNYSEIADKPVICRIHSYEIYTGYIKLIDWRMVDKAIFVSQKSMEIALEEHAAIAKCSHPEVIYNGLKDIEKFQFGDRSPGYNIALVGGINYKKNPSIWPEIAVRLMNKDQRYMLHVAGDFEDLRLKNYLLHKIDALSLDKNIRFYGRIVDIPKWYADQKINYLMSTSLFESFGYAIAEAMTMGYKPLINNFPGADELWPASCLFSDIKELTNLVTEEKYTSIDYNRFVTQRYSTERQLGRIDKLLNEL